MDAESDTDSTTSQPVNLAEDREWVDAEDDTEDVTFRSLLDDKTFKNVQDMLTYCKEDFGFDMGEVRKRLGIDELEQIKLINYIRSEVRDGNIHPDVSRTIAFEDDRYLRPILQDDALLYSLEDVFGAYEPPSQLNGEVESLRQQLASLQNQFSDYRNEVQKTLQQQIETTDDAKAQSPPSKSRSKPVDDGYFESYSYNSIHHSMLSDRIRTDAYRDFIYDNKDLFAGKIVLDVGCGTGILSMFCAKAGAKQVIAVDNSDIISKARENIRLNKLDDRIQCVRGKIEEVVLPVAEVDIIVSEWMGYCLLYESMLDSVIHARDKYLAKDGLMVPSHATLRIAPLADSDLKANHIDFWRDVYGFDMTPMLEKAAEEVIIRTVDTKELATGTERTDACTFKTFDLHSATVQDLSFTDQFELVWKQGFDKLEGFVIWFDTFFARDRSSQPDLDVEAARKQGIITLSTEPFSDSTHWQQGVLLIEDRTDAVEKGDKIDLAGRYEAGDKLSGTVKFSRESKESRFLQLEIEMADKKAGKPVLAQRWKLE